MKSRESRDLIAGQDITPNRGPAVNGSSDLDSIRLSIFNRITSSRIVRGALVGAVAVGLAASAVEASASSPKRPAKPSALRIKHRAGIESTKTEDGGLTKSPRLIRRLAEQAIFEKAVDESPEFRRPSGEFIGAMRILRLNPNELDQPDSKEYSEVTHRLNNGIWTSKSRGISVDPTPMLNYGAVYNQQSAPFGTKGATSVIAEHDVTKNYSPVNLNGTIYSQTENMFFPYAGSDENNPNAGQGNLEVGDEIQVFKNNPNNTETVFTYKIDQKPYLLNFNIDSDVQSLGNAPNNLEESQLRVYTCWPQGTSAFRQVYDAALISKSTISGNASYQGSELPIDSTKNG